MGHPGRPPGGGRVRAAACLLAGMAAFAAAPALLMGQGPRAAGFLPLREADLGVAADSLGGVVVLLAPGVTTSQGRTAQGLVWLRFHPDSALEWLNSAANALRTEPDASAPEGIQWSRPLAAAGGRGALTLGRARKKGRLQKAHWLAITDSVSGYRLELSAAQADSIIRLVFAMAPQATLAEPAEVLQPESMSPPAELLRQETPRSRGVLGQVVVQSIVGLDGRVEPGTSGVYLATEPELVAEALAIVRESRFRPALLGGRPARQLVRQVVAWRVR